MSSEKINGAQALIKCLERQGVEYIFGYPGGAAIPIFDALVNSTIKLILVRHEQGATHMADGYARVTGKPGVVLVTSGPGATNTVTGIMTAHMDSVPMIVLCGQTISPMLGKDAFQESDIFGITMPVVKHSYLVKETDAIPRIIKEAFHITSSGRPGPVLLDLPKDITSAPCEAPLDAQMDLPGYDVIPNDQSDRLQAMADFLSAAQKPLFLLGHGAVLSKAGEAILRLAEKLKAPVTNTLLGKGAVPETHPLCMGMLGMHGTAYANKALSNCDLIFSIGSRWDDRINGDNSDFCVGAKKLHIDIDFSEIGKIVLPDAYAVGDAKLLIEELIPLVEPNDTSEWIKELEGYRKKFPLSYKKHGGLKAQQVLDEMYQLVKGDAIVTTDVGQHQMWAAQFFLTDQPDSWLSSGGLGRWVMDFLQLLGHS